MRMDYHTTKAWISCIAAAAVIVVGCDSRTLFQTGDPSESAKAGDQPSMVITSRSPVVAGPNETVSLGGQNFRPGMKLAVASAGLTASRSVDVKVESDSKATFQVPGDLPFGGLQLTADQDGATQTISLIFNAGQTDHPIFTADATQVCAGTKFYDVAGSLKEGTKACSAGGSSASAKCTKDGELGCVTVAAFPAVDKAAKLVAGNILTGVTIAGVTGSALPRPSDCAANFTTGCVAVAAYQAVAPANLAAANIKSGVSIAGLTGTYPSASNPLTGSSATADLDLATFNAKIKSSSDFEWFDASGNHYINAGDAELATTANVANNVEIFGTTGTLVAGSNCTDAGQTGCLTTTTYRSTKNFRNTARSVTGTVIFDNTTTPSSANTDVYGDTIDDFDDGQANLPPDQPWGATYAASSTYWQDLTSDGACDSGTDQCVYRDKITGLMWSADSTHLDFSGVAAGTWPCGSSSCTQTSGIVTSGGGSGAYAANDPMRWWDAIYACNHLNTLGWNGQTSNWRLPTQKEMLEANVHGIRSVAGANWISDASLFRWSASTASNNLTSAWFVNLSLGSSNSTPKTNANAFACVR